MRLDLDLVEPTVSGLCSLSFVVYIPEGSVRSSQGRHQAVLLYICGRFPKTSCPLYLSIIRMLTRIQSDLGPKKSHLLNIAYLIQNLGPAKRKEGLTRHPKPYYKSRIPTAEP